MKYYEKKVVANDAAKQTTSEGYSRNMLCTLNLISMFLWSHCILITKLYLSTHKYDEHIIQT
jgi:hypothetical protein